MEKSRLSTGLDQIAVRRPLYLTYILTLSFLSAQKSFIANHVKPLPATGGRYRKYCLFASTL